jgi:hypothetical protein
MRIVNLTPHTINIQLPSGDPVEIPCAGLARVSSQAGSPLSDINGIPRYGAPVWGQVDGLPDPVLGTIYVVSALVAARSPRGDVYSPGTGPSDGVIRNDQGQIVAITRLVRSL